MAARTVIDVILGEAAAGTREQRYNDMLHIASVISNRSALTGRDPFEVVSAKRAGNKKEFDAYGKALPQGVNSHRDLAVRAWEDVQQNGPITAATFYATPKATKRLPGGLQQAAQTTGHVYFTDPRNRSIGVGAGFAPVNPANALSVRGADGLSAYAGVPLPSDKPQSALDAVNSLASSTALTTPVSYSGIPVPSMRPANPFDIARDMAQDVGQGVGRVLEAPRQIAVSAMNPLLSSLSGASRMTSANAAGNMQELLNTQFRTAENYFRAMTGKPFPPVNDALAKRGSTRESNTPNSMHFAGKAVDISIKGLLDHEKLALFESMQRAGFDAFGFGPTILHADVRGYPATWTYGDLGTWGGARMSTLQSAVRTGSLPENLKQQAWVNAPVPEARPELEAGAIVPPNPDAPRLDAYEGGYGNSAPASGAPLDPVEQGDPLTPAAYGGDPVLANAGGFVSPLARSDGSVYFGSDIAAGRYASEPMTGMAEEFPFIPNGPVGPDGKAPIMVGRNGIGETFPVPLDRTYQPVTQPQDGERPTLDLYDSQTRPVPMVAEAGSIIDQQTAAPVGDVGRGALPDPLERTPPSVSYAGTTSDDLAGDPLRGAIAQMADRSTAEANTPIPTPRPSIEPVPSSRPTMVGGTEIAGQIPTPGSRPQTQTAGVPVDPNPWSGMRPPTADPLSPLVTSYAEVDPMMTGATPQTNGFAANLAYAQGKPSQIDGDPSLDAPADPLAAAIRAPVQPLAPPVGVRDYTVKEASPVAPVEQRWSVPSGQDVWGRKSDFGIATDGSTLARNADGSVSRYSKEFDTWSTRDPRTGSWLPGGGPSGDDPLIGALGGMGLSRGGLSSKGKQSGQKSNLTNALKSAGKVGVATMNPFAAAAAGLLGWNANRIANNGGLLGNVVGSMYGVTPTYDSVEQQARAAALAANGGSFISSDSSDPRDYSYSPAAHDSISRGETVGLF